MLRSRVSVVFCVILCLLSIGMFAYTKYGNQSTVDNNFATTYLPNVMGVCRYETTEMSNVMKCNLTTVSVMIQGMLESGFYIKRDTSTDDTMDILIENGEDTYRFLFNRRTGDFVWISNDMTKIYIPLAYIHRREVSS